MLESINSFQAFFSTPKSNASPSTRHPPAMHLKHRKPPTELMAPRSGVFLAAPIAMGHPLMRNSRSGVFLAATIRDGSPTDGEPTLRRLFSSANRDGSPLMRNPRSGVFFSSANRDRSPTELRAPRSGVFLAATVAMGHSLMRNSRSGVFFSSDNPRWVTHWWGTHAPASF